MKKTSQTSDVPRVLQQQYVVCYQKVCSDAKANPVPMTVARCEVFEEGLLTVYDSATISINFDKKQGYPQDHTLKTDDHPPDIDPVLADHIKKVLVSLNLHQFAVPTRDHRDGGRDRGLGLDRDLGGKDISDTTDLSCFWCGVKGHTIFDCTGPAPTAVSKKACDEAFPHRDDTFVKRAAKIGSNEGRKALSLASVASAELISDDENEDSNDLIHAYVDMQSIFVPANEMTKFSCVRVLSVFSSCLVLVTVALGSQPKSYAPCLHWCYLENLPYSVSVYSS